MLPCPSRVTISVYDTEGRKVADILDEWMSCGEHVTVWGGSDNRGNKLPGGVYILRISAAGATESRKVLILD